MDEQEHPEGLDDEQEDVYFDDYDEDDVADEEDESLSLVSDNLDRFMAVADVDSVFGEAYEQGEAMIIPAAEVGSMLGFGLGSGYGGDERQNGGAGSGGGGGGWSFSRPVAVIIATPQGVRVEPIIDLTKIALAAFTAVGVMAGMAFRMRRFRR